MVSEPYSYLFTINAELDLDEILNYISVILSNPEAASSFVDELTEKLSLLCSSPRIGIPVTNEYFLRSDVRKIFIGNYVVYYTDDSVRCKIIILRIIYGKRDQSSVLSGLI